MNFCGAQRRFSLLSNIIINGLYHELSRGVDRIFQRGGGVTLCQTLSSWRFRHGMEGCLLKKDLQRGGGVTGTLGPPSLRPC